MRHVSWRGAGSDAGARVAGQSRQPHADKPAHR